MRQSKRQYDPEVDAGDIAIRFPVVNFKEAQLLTHVCRVFGPGEEYAEPGNIPKFMKILDLVGFPPPLVRKKTR